MPACLSQKYTLIRTAVSRIGQVRVQSRFGVGTEVRREKRGTGTAGSSAGDRIAGGPRCCCSLRYLKVRHHFGMRSYVHVGLRGRAGRRGLCRFVQLLRGTPVRHFDGLRTVFLRCGGARERGRESSAFSAKVMHHFHAKIGPKTEAIEVPRELILAAKSARKCGCSRLVVCRRCTGFVYVLYRLTELNRNGTP